MFDTLPLESTVCDRSICEASTEIALDQKKVIDFSQLSPIQRIILATDGTLTRVLEAYLSEKICLAKISEEMFKLTQEITPLNASIGTEVIKRKVLLQGELSKKNWLYAESIIVLDRLEEKHKYKLLNSRQTIGRLWLEHRLETFKEAVASQKEEAAGLEKYFEINSSDQMLSRTYRVFSGRMPIMLITEKFPDSYFT
ncbi:MAG: 4-hydroxybenzoate synthetase [SAR324 cluster bacterium]|uniref:4-hydroxybenzoate synthetase n=1 Tax=SAR324 cluster bacterium TaxID=2024889 RepID=A0A2A4T5N7_9DELT|nr:MAG: 4-hydroxybenzoate synthetase [SAR324 cluster bacterium]